MLALSLVTLQNLYALHTRMVVTKLGGTRKGMSFYNCTIAVQSSQLGHREHSWSIYGGGMEVPGKLGLSDTSKWSFSAFYIIGIFHQGSVSSAIYSTHISFIGLGFTYMLGTDAWKDIDPVRKEFI